MEDEGWMNDRWGIDEGWVDMSEPKSICPSKKCFKIVSKSSKVRTFLKKCISNPEKCKIFLKCATWDPKSASGDQKSARNSWKVHFTMLNHRGFGEQNEILWKHDEISRQRNEIFWQHDEISWQENETHRSQNEIHRSRNEIFFALWDFLAAEWDICSQKVQNISKKCNHAPKKCKIIPESAFSYA